MASNSESGSDFFYTGFGTDSEANHYCSRDYGTGSDSNGPGLDDAYHYSIQDGSYYYPNADGSSYYNDNSGSAWYEQQGSEGDRYYNNGDGWYTRDDGPDDDDGSPVDGGVYGDDGTCDDDGGDDCTMRLDDGLY